MGKRSVNKDQIFETIRKEIITRHLRPGQPIIEEEFAKRFGTSRTPIREVFQRLEREGLVNIVQYRGTYVSDLTPNDFQEILDIRIALESLAAKRAAQNYTEEYDDELNHIEDLIQRAERVKNRNIAFKVDSLLHQFVLKIAQNNRLTNVINGLTGQIFRIRFVSGLVRGRSEVALEEHLEIVKAIRSRNAALAETRMRDHLSNTKKLLLNLSEIIKYGNLEELEYDELLENMNEIL